MMQNLEEERTLLNDIKSKNLRPRCLNCELDFFFKKRFRNEKKGKQKNHIEMHFPLKEFYTFMSKLILVIMPWYILFLIIFQPSKSINS